MGKADLPSIWCRSSLFISPVTKCRHSGNITKQILNTKISNTEIHELRISISPSQFYIFWTFKMVFISQNCFEGKKNVLNNSSTNVFCFDQYFIKIYVYIFTICRSGIITDTASKPANSLLHMSINHALLRLQQ